MHNFKSIKPFFVISRYKETFDWIHNYTENFLIYNKGEPIDGDSRILNVNNIGENIQDISEFICSYYENLPELTVFVQANPWDHCRKEVFDKLILNDKFTPLESYNNIAEIEGHKKDTDGGYMEINTNWYIVTQKIFHDKDSVYDNFDRFMNKYFDNYVHLEYIRFSPGVQYLVTKADILQYPKHFWESLRLEIKENKSTEAMIIERALWLIFTKKFNLRKEFYE
jgi:hypothetical protein